MRYYRWMASTANAPKKEVQDILEIVVAFPPNYEIIQVVLPHAGREHTYIYGGKIYNPSGKKLPLDIQYHEYIHSLQHEEYPGGCDAWWTKYLMDPDFRIDQEIQAYGEQYHYAKRHLVETDEDIRAHARRYGEKKHLGGGVNNILREILNSMAMALAGPEYGNLISYGAAEAAIKRYGK